MRSKGLVAGLVVVTVMLGFAVANAERLAVAPTVSPTLNALPAPPSPSTTPAVIFFGADAMRPDLMEGFVAEGVMPTFAELIALGVKGDNGLLQGFPPSAGVGPYTLATGTWPGEHGSTNNTYHRTGDLFNNRTSFSTPGTLQADTLAAAAERAGKKVAQINWTGGANSGILGPTVDFMTSFSTRGVLVTPLNAVEQGGAAAFGVSYQVAGFAPAAGWTNVPASDPAAPPMQTQLSVASTFAAQNPNRAYDVFVYDGVVDGVAAYDRVLLVRAAAAKDGNQAAVNLGAGDFKEIKLRGADGLIGARAGQTAGFYAKLVTLTPDLSGFKLYFTSVERAIATCGTAACAALPGGNLENYIADNLPTAIASDFAPLEAGIVDEATYVQQGRDLGKAYGDALVGTILGTLQPETNLAFVGYPTIDEFSRQFLGLVTPTDMDGAPNPYFDDVEGNGTPDGRVDARQGYLRSAYTGADALLSLARSLMPNATVFAASGQGAAPQWYAVNAAKILADSGLQSAEQPSNCRAAAGTNLAKACWAGGTVQIYVNTTLPAGTTYGEVRSSVIDAFQNLTDPAQPGAQVVDRILRKEELRNVDGSDSLHPSRSGDVVVVLRPPYQFDAATPGQRIASSRFFGNSGYVPNLVDLAHNVNMHGTFVAAGQGVAPRSAPLAGVRAIDLAPTIAFVMGIPGPQNARGRILLALSPDRGRLKEVAVLNISDYHGQLVPLAEAADDLNAGGTVNPSFGVGGAAFLKPWFDVYRADSPGGSLTVAGGDSVGATPPVSSLFGDTPTIEAMNAMGFKLDGLGNHNFDRGQAYLRSTLIPLASFPYVSANIVDARGRTPAEWKPSVAFDFIDGGKVGFVGFTNEDAPALAPAGAFGPFHVEPRLARVQAEVNLLRNRGVKSVLVIGHDGATAGTPANPSGPLIDLADALTGVDAVLGDHTDVQVAVTRPNGVLVTENKGRGARFTRVRLVLDSRTKSVVYKTADFHKPWNVGVTPDAAIAARLAVLNTQLVALLGAVSGYSTVAIPRSDSCGRADGRLCESLVGDSVTDAMRRAYGTDFAITNSGGLRDQLTCSPAGGGAGLCPIFTPPPYPITRGQVLAVLPFGNVVVTLSLNGAELKTMLENGVSQMPAASGRFAQVSGLCFTYDVAAPVGSRVLSAVRQAADGSCTGGPVDLTAGSTYTVAENDFMMNGGDGYPNFFGRAATRDFQDQVVANDVTARSPIGPSIQGRIVCTTSGATACPVGGP